MFDQCGALQGENRRAHGTVEQLDAERLLETGDHLRDRRLRQLELFCRSHHGSALGDDGEDFERADSQAGAERCLGQSDPRRSPGKTSRCVFAALRMALLLLPLCTVWRTEVILSISHAEEHENRTWRVSEYPGPDGR